MALSIRLFIMFALLLATLSPSMTAIPLNAQSNEPVPIWTVTGNGVGKMGEIAINAGDLNQDGYADIAVGGSGKIVLYAGSADGLAGEPELVVTEFNEAPSYVDNLLAGDFDGDGEIDLVLAAPFADESMGALYLYYGAEGETGVPWTLFGAVADSTLGKGLDRGDFNGDGIADLVVSAPSTYNDEVAGEVYLYYGSTSELGDPATPDLVLRGADPALRYGDVVRNVGDLNGDGYDDLVIQAEDDDLRIDLHFGSPDGLAAEPLTSLYAQQYDFIFADSVAALGDVNGDGYADFAVAAANIDDLLIAYLIYGAAEWEEMSSESIQLPDTGRLDAIVNQVGDVDGDGYDDLAFSLVVPTYRDEGTSAVYLFRGGAGGIELDPAYVISTDVIADGFGYAVAPADVNGDGVPELLIGAPGDTTAGDFAGKAYLYSFTAKAPVGMTDGLRWQPSRIQEIVSPDADDLAGIQPTAIGDINGDGYDDLAALGLRGTGDGAVSYVAILLGSAEGLPDKPDLAAPATNWRAALGDVAGELSFWTVAGVGDLNGDGLDDFGLTVLTDAGDVVLLFAGGEEEPEEEPIGLLHAPGYDPENAEAYPYYFAEQLHGVGDLNGDGFGDLIVLTAPRDEDGDGLLSLYLGGADGVADEVVWELTVGPMLTQIYPSVAAPGDLNGDGYDELLVGNPILIDDEATTSYLALYAGSEAGLSSEPLWQEASNETQQMLGVRLVAPGDLDGDGAADLVTTALYENAINLLPLTAGDVEVWSATLQDAPATSIADQYLGLGLLPAGDVNGDGYADLLAGNSSDLDSVEDTVAWELLFGGVDGLVKSGVYDFDHPLTTVADAGLDGGFFSLMLKAYWQPGDFNGDGYSDLVFGYSDPLSSVEDLDGAAPAPLTIYYGGPSTAETAAADPAISLRDTITVRIEAATFASLSPDGEWLLVDRAQEDESAEGTQLCLIEVADMGDECILMPDLASVQGPFVAWSSDSRYVVLNEDPTAVSTTNVWLFDLDTGDDLNLSALFPPAETPEQHYDRAPAISPSLEMVAFVRHTDDESWIHLVNLATEAHSTMPMTAGIIGNLRWLPDGSGLFYTLFNSASPADNGLWQVTLNDRAAVQLYEVPELYGPPFLSAVAETGNSVLLVYPMHEERADAPKAGYYYELISLPVAQGADLLSTGFWRSAAALAPDGATLMTVEEGRDAHRVTVQSVITGELTEAIELVSLDLDLTATSESFGLGATWYAPERIFLAGRFDAEMNGRLLIVE